MDFKAIEKLSPADFERLIVLMLRKQGYETEHIAQGEDIGIDILAKKNGESIAVQVKKYESRKINLAMIYHTFGAAAYYNCSKAVIATLSELTPRAQKAARKLKVEFWERETLMSQIESLSITMEIQKAVVVEESTDWFYDIWNTHIKSLQGTEVKHLSRDTHITVVDVNDDGMTIVNSNGNRRHFEISIFRQVITKFKSTGSITREEINNDYQRRGASAISAVLATIPGVHKDRNTQRTTLVWKT